MREAGGDRAGLPARRCAGAGECRFRRRTRGVRTDQAVIRCDTPAGSSGVARPPAARERYGRRRPAGVARRWCGCGGHVVHDSGRSPLLSAWWALPREEGNEPFRGAPGRSGGNAAPRPWHGRYSQSTESDRTAATRVRPSRSGARRHPSGGRPPRSKACEGVESVRRREPCTGRPTASVRFRARAAGGSRGSGFRQRSCGRPPLVERRPSPSPVSGDRRRPGARAGTGNGEDRRAARMARGLPPRPLTATMAASGGPDAGPWFRCHGDDEHGRTVAAAADPLREGPDGPAEAVGRSRAHPRARPIRDAGLPRPVLADRTGTGRRLRRAAGVTSAAGRPPESARPPPRRRPRCRAASARSGSSSGSPSRTGSR